MNSREEVFVHLVYIDDSADEGIQIIGAAIVPESKFMVIEEYLAHTIDSLVPEELQDDFEFHASALFHAKPPFKGLDRDTAIEILRSCVSIVETAPIPIIYGA